MPDGGLVPRLLISILAERQNIIPRMPSDHRHPPRRLHSRPGLVYVLFLHRKGTPIPTSVVLAFKSSHRDRESASGICLVTPAGSYKHPGLAMAFLSRRTYHFHHRVLGLVSDGSVMCIIFASSNCLLTPRQCLGQHKPPLAGGLRAGSHQFEKKRSSSIESSETILRRRICIVRPYSNISTCTSELF